MARNKPILPIEIRTLQLSDLDDIMEIEPAAYGTHHWSRQSFVSELTNPSGNYYGAVDPEDGKLVGYSGYWLIGDEAHVTTLAVHPERRRKKIAERLLLNNIVEAKKMSANWLTLEVRVSNEAAQKLYSRYLFRRLGVRRRYYQDNSEDALVLWTERFTEPKFLDMLVTRMSEFNLPADEVRELFLGYAAYASDSNVMADRATA